ncbi:hypothetical protein FRB93_007483 [Tulasnella sp. JGI-2019a]|nr:hypothetical protein FRB93_007483 [Tulasnella sp. JGI-2019a]
MLPIVTISPQPSPTQAYSLSGLQLFAIGSPFTNYAPEDQITNNFNRLLTAVLVLFFVFAGFSIVSLAYCAFQLHRMVSRRRALEALPWNRPSTNVKRDRAPTIKFDEPRKGNKRNTRSTSPTSSIHSGELSEAEFGEVMHARRVSVSRASPSLRNTPSPEGSHRGRNVPSPRLIRDQNANMTRSTRGASVRSKETVRNVDFVMVSPRFDGVDEELNSQEFEELAYATPTRNTTISAVRFTVSPPTPAASSSEDSPSHGGSNSPHDTTVTPSASGSGLLDVSLDGTPSSWPARNVAEWRRSLTLSDLMLDPRISRSQNIPDGNVSTSRSAAPRTLSQRVIPRLRSLSALSSSIGQSIFWSPTSAARDQSLQTPGTTFFARSLLSSTFGRGTGGAAQSPTLVAIRPSISQPFDVKMETRDQGFELVDLDPKSIRANQVTLPSDRKPVPEYIPVRSRAQFDQFCRRAEDDEVKRNVQKTRRFDDRSSPVQSTATPMTVRRVSLLQSELDQLETDPFRRATPPITHQGYVDGRASTSPLLQRVPSPRPIISVRHTDTRRDPRGQPMPISMEKLVGSMMSAKRNTFTMASSLSNRASSLQSRYDITHGYGAPRSHFSPPDTPSPHPPSEDDEDEQDVTDVFGKDGGPGELGFWQKLGQGIVALNLSGTGGIGVSSPPPLPNARVLSGRKPIPSKPALPPHASRQQSQKQSRSNGSLRHMRSSSVTKRAPPKQLITGSIDPQRQDLISKRLPFKSAAQTPYRPPRRESLQLANRTAVADILDVALKAEKIVDRDGICNSSGAVTIVSGNDTPLRLSDFPAPPPMSYNSHKSDQGSEGRGNCLDLGPSATSSSNLQQETAKDLFSPVETVAFRHELGTIPSIPSLQSIAQKFPQTSTPVNSIKGRRRMTFEHE